ncbi:MAG: AAA family ATPase [Nitrososphaeraceae archaeon]|jgi:predicted ATPase
MLKKIHITNLLSCKDTEIELEDITALIGRNAAGKTNILKAIQWCAQYAVGKMHLYEHLKQFFGLNTECDLEFVIDSTIFKYELKIKSEFAKEEVFLNEALSYHLENEWKLICERNNDKAILYNNEENIFFEIKSQAPVLSSMISLLPSKKLDPSITKIYKYLSGVKYYALDDFKYKNDNASELSGIIFGDKYEQWLSTDNKEDSSVDRKLLHLWHENKTMLAEIGEIVGVNGLNLINRIDIDKFPVGQPSDGENLQDVCIIRYYVTNIPVNYNQLSYGTQRILTLLLALLYDKSSTLLLEQPEDGIHSGLLKKLLPLCVTYSQTDNRQLVIATHSPEVINTLNPESIRLVRMTENGTKVSTLSKEQVPYICEYINNDGTLYEFIESMDDE